MLHMLEDDKKRKGKIAETVRKVKKQTRLSSRLVLTFRLLSFMGREVILGRKHLFIILFFFTLYFHRSYSRLGFFIPLRTLSQ